MRFEGIIFDLDGTLLDTLEDLAGCMNDVLGRMGFPAHPVENYKAYVGDGMDMLAMRVLPEKKRDESTVKLCVAAMKKEYEKRWAEKTRIYDGILELVDRCSGLGLKMAVLSNKSDEFTKKIVAHFFGDRFFMVIGGGIFPKKPNPAAPLHIAKQMGVRPDRILYLGDTNTDMKTAVSAGMTAAGALWGFRTEKELVENGARYLVKRPSDVLKLLE